ncbi:gephyrin-like molybdotransferase Glp [Cellulomonas shaoxiangyii]|uniref:Molybdopterin molybdenumtransferase n=1 Tax=Cellulomonas shaoxiangyii TaxID=2566013 RepID=A0A4P7SKR2_9CELL|nr:gephyrin-like molybdotransferase Glp [Cellulomonas shaoxiangyii]QCB94471.1 molybdopterin molybdotransferase MoeA [Cellulomonas shaoxiangyii]TGY86053.1 molybdopterin molybdotransferase MoeA [Cellulomonas shaoxiangyii]
MRSVQDHLAAVLAAVGPVTPLDVLLHDASGCILAADVAAPIDVPAVPVAARDGYAVAARDTEHGAGGRVPDLPVAHDVHAGSPAGLRHVAGTAVRVASGGPLPIGADAVVPIEETDRGTARVALQRPARPGQHVRHAGADVHAGDVVLPAGTRLGARQIALAAAMGRGRLPVHPTPRVVLLSVGDELVEPTTAVRPGTVFEADGHALEAAVLDAGAAAVRVGVVPDERATLREALEDQLVRADLVVLTGGLSELVHDTVKDVLAPLGTVRLDQVAMTPGMRHGFGTVGRGVGGRDEDQGVPVFALQGHPVAAQVSFEVFVRPALRAMAGHTELFRPSVAAAATQGWASPPGLRQFVPATVLGSPDEGYRVTPLGDPAAPSTTALAHANALAVVGETDAAVRPGQVVHCLVLEG